MPPSRLFPREARSRPGVSELYASMLMVGVTLTLGSFVVAAAVNQAGLADGAASAGASIAQSTSGAQLGLVYVAVAQPGSCPTYGGYAEGGSLTLAVYNYGTSDFRPYEIAVNSTVYAGVYGTLGAGSLVEYTVPLGTCAHPWGQTLLLEDSSGEGVQFGS